MVTRFFFVTISKNMVTNQNMVTKYGHKIWSQNMVTKSIWSQKIDFCDHIFSWLYSGDHTFFECLGRSNGQTKFHQKNWFFDFFDIKKLLDHDKIKVLLFWPGRSNGQGFIWTFNFGRLVTTLLSTIYIRSIDRIYCKSYRNLVPNFLIIFFLIIFYFFSVYESF